MATVTINYCGVEASGPTVTKAKQEAARIVESFAKTGPAPRIITAGRYACLIYRDFDGWRGAMVADCEGLREGRIWGDSGEATLDDAERKARCHLADLATDWRTCRNADDVHSVCKNESDRRNIANGCAWQRRYHAYKARGFNDNECHCLAGGAGYHLNLPQIPECDAA